MSFHYKKYHYTQKQNLKIKITLQTDASNSTLKKNVKNNPIAKINSKTQ